MPKQTTVPPVSLRQGKLYPSQRYADPGARDTALRTNWRLGPDALPRYESNAQAAQADVAQVPPEVLALRQPRVLKNSSDKESIQGSSTGLYSNPAVLYSTTTASTMGPSTTVFSADYVKGKPAFDRLNASKTNYSLASQPGHYDLRTTSHAHHADPKSWAARRGFEPPAVGGWTKANGDYCADEASRGSVLRGGGGGEGALGVRFNVVTNAPQPDARQRVLQRTGPRASANVTDPWRAGADRFGAPQQAGGRVDVLSGRLVKAAQAPPRATAQDLRRPDENILRTRPW